LKKIGRAAFKPVVDTVPLVKTPMEGKNVEQKNERWWSNATKEDKEEKLNSGRISTKTNKVLPKYPWPKKA